MRSRLRCVLRPAGLSGDRRSRTRRGDCAIGARRDWTRHGRAAQIGAERRFLRVRKQFLRGQLAASFWGPNYSRLLAAKRQYDPDGLFFVHHGVGSEDWSADGFTRT